MDRGCLSFTLSRSRSVPPQFNSVDAGQVTLKDDFNDLGRWPFFGQTRSPTWNCAIIGAGPYLSETKKGTTATSAQASPPHPTLSPQRERVA